MYSEALSYLPTESSVRTARASILVGRNVTIGGHRTSVRLEPDMWSGLREICYRQQQTLHQLCTMIAQQKKPGESLTAAIRVFIVGYYRRAATEDGHSRAGHGAGGPFAPRRYAPAIVFNDK